MLKFFNIEFLLYANFFIASLNIFIPFITEGFFKIRKTIMVIIAIIFFVNNILLNFLYLDGLRINITLFSLYKYDIAFMLNGMGQVFLSLVSFLWIIAIIYSSAYLRINNENNQERFLSFINLSIFITCLIALAANLMTSFVCYELLTLSTIPLIGHNGSAHAKKSLKTYLFFLMASSLILFLPATIYIYHVSNHTIYINGGIENLPTDKITIYILYSMFVFGIAKAAIMPMHKWLPAAMVASHPVSALLHAVAVVKSGLFILYKITSEIFGLEFLYSYFGTNNIFVYLAITSMIISSIIAVKQVTIKKMLAYSTISQLSFALMSLFMFSHKALIAAFLHLVAHSLSKITLFFAAGNIYTLTRFNKVDEFVGIARIMPQTFTAFTIAALSLIGIPPLSGFISKYYILNAAVHPINYPVITAVILSTIVTATYLFKIISLAYKHTTLEPIKYSKVPFGMKFSTISCAILTVIFVAYIKHVMIFLPVNFKL